MAIQRIQERAIRDKSTKLLVRLNLKVNVFSKSDKPHSKKGKKATFCSKVFDDACVFRHTILAKRKSEGLFQEIIVQTILASKRPFAYARYLPVYIQNCLLNKQSWPGSEECSGLLSDLVSGYNITLNHLSPTQKSKQKIIDSLKSKPHRSVFFEVNGVRLLGQMSAFNMLANIVRNSSYPLDINAIVKTVEYYFNPLYEYDYASAFVPLSILLGVAICCYVVVSRLTAALHDLRLCHIFF